MWNFHKYLSCSTENQVPTNETKAFSISAHYLMSYFITSRLASFNVRHGLRVSISYGKRPQKTRFWGVPFTCSLLHPVFLLWFWLPHLGTSVPSDWFSLASLIVIPQLSLLGTRTDLISSCWKLSSFYWNFLGCFSSSVSILPSLYLAQFTHYQALENIGLV